MASPHDLTGRTLDGRYRVTKLLGEGGMGHVYEAIHTALGRKVAIKTLHPRLAYEERFRERFIREAKSASSIQHPNVVQIMDFGDTPDGSVYFVMEHLEGRDLGSLLREQGKLPWARTREILVQAVRALAAAHAQSIVHRDIKPGNCFLTTTGAGLQQELVKLLDFGIAKVGTEAEGGDGGPRLTGTGEVFGTASYMAPEQARGELLDARSDLYSLGIMAYEMLTGQVPFTGINSLHVITKHLTEKPRPPRVLEPSIPPVVEAVVLRAIAKEAKDRFASMVELEAALLAIPAEAEAPRGRTTGAGTGAGARSGASTGVGRVASVDAPTRAEPSVKGRVGAGVARAATGSASARPGVAKAATGSASARPGVAAKSGGASGGSARVATGTPSVAKGGASGRPAAAAASVRPKASVPPPTPAPAPASRSGASVRPPAGAPAAATRGGPPRVPQVVSPPAARGVASSGAAVPMSRAHVPTEPAPDANAPRGAYASTPGAPLVLPPAARDPSFHSGSIPGVPQVLPSAAHDPSHPSHPSLAVPRPLALHEVSGELGRFGSGPIAVESTGQTTVPPPGQLDQSTSPSISLRAPSQTGASPRMTGPNVADTSPHVLRKAPSSRSVRRVAWVLGAIAFVSLGSIAATLMVLRSEREATKVEAGPPTQELENGVEPSGSEGGNETPKIEGDGGVVPGPTEQPATPDHAIEAADAIEADPAAAPNDAIEPVVVIEPKTELEPTDDAPEPADDQPTAEAPSPTKRPLYLTQPCIDRRARAQAALDARAWKELLSATSKASCWPLTEQDARRGMRVLAYLDLGDLDACIASGKGVKDKKTREAVKTCEELRGP